ncbi:prepilin-type N-terminal cleavage/methylation domain-containing protein [Lacticaseibacillus sharpeae]|uniref:Prepilin-type N-terminal cleavage/methylation domain-containing protein n=1 Tax=Lacticaseibacillus sharpeae JCM 1186 = DSM 20505 TaxID=1291052 RepID=A0A0R1ZST5_9LACO|nr:prepilin-type N-terminal cleavage/methylation domain-containing protein [Lacticaseibacillus sharpeae]KRM54745.1 hypothetical protein FC18_GL002159 [Lacticaseibacillus sharpeae JCM 1186 = DSM 20505]
MKKMIKRRKGFTLIEVLAALAIIVVLTLALILMVKGQVDQANKKDNRLLEQTVNAQIEVQMDDTGTSDKVTITNIGDLRDEGFISAKQYEQLSDKHAKFKTSSDGVPQVDIP